MEIVISINKRIELPIAYHHIIQSALYSLLVEGENSYYHDNGANYGSRVYKLFSFSLFEGKYQVKSGRIAFPEGARLTIRSVDIHLIKILERNLREKGFRLGDHVYSELVIELSNPTIENDMVEVEMKSPICVYTTDVETKKTTYFSPYDDEFARLVNENFKRKYMATYGEEPDTELEISPSRVSDKDKYVTKYKDYYITAWGGFYTIKSKRKYIDFIYQVGIGGKNSQGFGLARMVKSRSTS